MMGYYDDGSWGVGAWLLMGAIMLIFWGGLIAALVWAVGSYRRGRPGAESPTGQATRAEQLLAERFARGEIDQEEFERRNDLLRTAAGHHE
jgi:putative membrane protein